MHFDRVVTFYKSSLLSIPHGFGTKMSGDGRDTDTIRDVLTTENIMYSAIAIPQQTHSTNVALLEHASNDTNLISVQDTDGMVTTEKGVVLTVVTADCVPILYYDEVAKTVGISHGGWKGTLNNIPEHVIKAMEQIGSDRRNIKAVIGPAINDCCYELYGERLNLFEERFGQKVLTKQGNVVTVSLIRLNYMLLNEAGILSENINYMPSCTSCNVREFYSYHRDQEIKGEMISFIMLP